jgi:YVTN family beta-propeller protein
MLRFFNIYAAAIVLTLAVIDGSPVHGASVLNSVAPPGVIFELLALNRDLPTAAKPKYLSPTDLVASPDSGTLYVVEQTAKQIAVINLQTNTVTKEIELPNEVTGLAVAPDGSKLYATCSSDLWPSGMVCEVDISSGRVARKIAAGHGARAPVISPDGTILYTCNSYNNNVSVIDIAAGKETARIPVIRQPYCAGITPDGSVLVVANSLPLGKSTDTAAMKCNVSLIATATGKVTDTIALAVGSHSAYNLTVSPDGNYAFITHLIGMFTLPAVLVEGGWINTNNCAIIDIKEHKLLNDVCLDKATTGSANPWGIACTKDASILCVAHSGSNELSIIDLRQMIDSAKTGTDISHDLVKLYKIKQKVPVKGKGPRALSVIGNKAYTAGYFGSEVEIFDLSLIATTPSGTITLGPSQPLTAERKGEYYFSDGTICHEKWESCSSCHPFARTDGLNWILGSENNAPKNASSMVYSWWTPPTSWSGRRRNAYEQIRAGIKNVLFREPDERIAVCIDTFFMNLKPVPSPYLVKGKLSAAAERGRDLYRSPRTDCYICHFGPLSTDNSFHNAGVPDPYDGNRDWNTPIHIEIWRNGPYGHIGSFDKIEDMMKFCGHTRAGTLSNNEFSDLLEYVLSL